MTQSKTTIFTAALSLAILLTFSCSSSDDGGGGGNNVPTQSSETEGSISSSSNENGSVPTQSSETEGSISSSSSKNGSVQILYCDYGPVTQYGGGCFEIENESECDLQWGQVVATCGGQSSSNNGSSSSNKASSSSKVATSSSSVALSSSSVAKKIYCDYGPVTQYGGGCFEVEKESECDLEWGKVVSSCGGQSSGSNPSSSSGYTFSQFFNVANEAWTTNAGRGFILHSDSTCTGIRETEIGSNNWYQDGGSVRPKLTFQYQDGYYTIVIKEECWFAGVNEPLRVIDINTLQGSRTVTRKSIVGSSSSSSAVGSGLCAGFTNGTERLHYGKNKPQFCDERDGQKYVYVTIGTQIWMAENLNYGGTGIPCGGNDCPKYGRLYSWAGAMNLATSYNSNTYGAVSTQQGICPSGWHLPTNNEWTTLFSFVRVSNFDQGKRLKAASEWGCSSCNGTDDHGFSALPAGGQNLGENYDVAGQYGNWWNASEYSAVQARYNRMTYFKDDTSGGYDAKTGLQSVRCVKN